MTQHRPTLRFGKTPARHLTKLKLQDYLIKPQLPTPPDNFSYAQFLPHDAQGQVACGMLANDQYGDCVLAGGAHEHMLWTGAAHAVVPKFTPDAVLSDYTAITGFNPKDPESDQGTDMQVAADYRRKTGLVDADGKRHMIGAYVAVQPETAHQLRLASYMFCAVGLGLVLGDAQIDQFTSGRPWAGRPTGDRGGHYVPLVGFEGKNALVITWGKLQRLSLTYLARYSDEALVYFSDEMISQGKGPTGLDVAQLSADLNAVTTAR